MAAVLVLIMTLGIFPSDMYCAYGKTVTVEDIDAMEKYLEDIRLNIDQNEKALAAIKNEQSYTESAINYSLSLIGDYTQYSKALLGLICEYDLEIERLDAEIKKEQKEFDEIYLIYLNRLQCMKEDSGISLLQLILESKSLADFIISLERANEAIRYDRELLEEINGKKSELEEKKLKLEELKNGKQKQVLECEAFLSAALKRVEELKDYLCGLEEQLEDKEEQKKLWEKLELEADLAVKELMDAYLKQNSSTPSYAIGEEMRWPLDSRWNYISSKFGYRTHPITGELYSFHGAVDIPANGGENIYVAISGVVVISTWHWSYGNYILIDHGIIKDSGKHLYTLYAHCSELVAMEGDKVSIGDVIAKVGTTGSSKGNHLHFEVRLDNEKVNPLDYVDVP